MENLICSAQCAARIANSQFSVRSEELGGALPKRGYYQIVVVVLLLCNRVILLAKGGVLKSPFGLVICARTFVYKPFCSTDETCLVTVVSLNFSDYVTNSYSTIFRV